MCAHSTELLSILYTTHTQHSFFSLLYDDEHTHNTSHCFFFLCLFLSFFFFFPFFPSSSLRTHRGVVVRIPIRRALSGSCTSTSMAYSGIRLSASDSSRGASWNRHDRPRLKSTVLTADQTDNEKRKKRRYVRKGRKEGGESKRLTE